MSRSLGDLAARLTRPEGLLVATAVVGGIASGFSGVQPTAVALWNPILAAIFAGVVAVSASRARWFEVTWMGIIGTVATGLIAPSVWTLVAVVATAFGLASDVSDRNLRPLLRTMSASIAVLTLYRLPPIQSFGVPSLIAALAVLPVLFAGWRNLGPPVGRAAHRWRTARRALIYSAALTGISVVIAGLAAFSVPGAAQRAAGEARRGDFGAASQTLGGVSSRARIAHWALNGPWAWPGRLVPIVSQHLDLAGRGASAGYRGTRAGRRITGVLANSSLQTPDGGVNIGLVEAVVPDALRATQAVYDVSRAVNSEGTNWLAPPLKHAVEDNRATIERAARAAAGAESLVGYMPALLGSPKATRYFVMFGTPAESRELGGLLGAYGIVDLDQGKISLVEAGDNGQLAAKIARAGTTVDPPEKYGAWMETLNVAKYPQNLTSSVHLREVADMVQEVVAPSDGTNFDAVVYLDPYAIEAIVGLVGEIPVTGTGEVLNARNTAEFLLEGQYYAFDDPRAREAFLVSMLEDVFSSLSTIELPSFSQLVDTFQPLAEQKRIQVATFNSSINGALDAAQLYHPFPYNNRNTDLLAINSHNGAPTKLDNYLTRTVDYDVTFDPATGEVKSRLTIEMLNSPPEELPDYMVSPPNFAPGAMGRNRLANRTVLSIYTPLHLVSKEVVDYPNDDLFVSWSEFGFRRHTVTFDLQPNVPKTAVFELEGRVGPGDYRLEMISQPLVNTDQVNITARAVDGWRLDTGAVSFDFAQDKDVTFFVPAYRE